MSIIKLFASSGGGATLISAAADIPEDGRIEAVTLSCNMVSDATPTNARIGRAEISFLSSATFSINDVRGSLCQVLNAEIGAAAADGLKLNPAVSALVVAPIDVMVAAGERVFLHVQSTSATATFEAIGYLYIRDGADLARGTRRR